VSYFWLNLFLLNIYEYILNDLQNKTKSIESNLEFSLWLLVDISHPFLAHIFIFWVLSHSFVVIMICVTWLISYDRMHHLFSKSNIKRSYLKFPFWHFWYRTKWWDTQIELYLQFINYYKKISFLLFNSNKDF